MFFSSTVTVTGIYSASIAPPLISASDLPAGSATSINAATTVFNGVGPFTYLWTQESGDSMTINSDTSDTTNFTTSGSSGEFKSGVFKVTVTDTGNGDAETDATVTVLFAFEGQS